MTMVSAAEMPVDWESLMKERKSFKRHWRNSTCLLFSLEIRIFVSVLSNDRKALNYQSVAHNKGVIGPKPSVRRP